MRKCATSQKAVLNKFVPVHLTVTGSDNTYTNWQSLGQTTPTQTATAIGSDNTYTNWHNHWVRQHLHKLIQPLGQTTLHKLTASGLDNTTHWQSQWVRQHYTNWHSYWVRQHLHKLTVTGSDNTYTNWQSVGQTTPIQTDSQWVRQHLYKLTQSVGQITSTQTDKVSGVRHTDQWGPPSFWQLVWRCRHSASRCMWHPRWWRWLGEDRSCSWTCLSPGATAHSVHCKHST